MSSVKERLFEIIRAKGLSQAAFQRKCKLGNGFCNKVNDGMTDSSYKAIEVGYPDVNINWLKTGEGEMFIEEEEDTSVEDIYKSNLALIQMVKKLIELGDKNYQANLVNAEANMKHAENLERLINIIEKKL